MNIEFCGKIWFWKGPAPWFYFTVPAKPSGRLPSMFPKDGRYIVPIKASVREAENLEVGDKVTVRLEVT